MTDIIDQNPAMRLAAVRARSAEAHQERAAAELDAYPKQLDGTPAPRGRGEGPSGVHARIQIDALTEEITLLEREARDLEQQLA